MKTIRRRAASPLLQWRSAGANRQYRVGVRNEDTGDKQTIYEGFRQECRLPPELRLTPNQLSFRVESRDAETPDAPYVNVQPFTRIPRFGDDLAPHAPDVVRSPEVAGATAYRLMVRESLSEDVLVDMVVDEPWALVPPGLIKSREVEWTLRPRVAGTWRKAAWSPLSAEAIEAARERALRMIAIEDEVRVRPEAEGVTWPTPKEIALPAAPARTAHLAVAVAVSAQPDLAPDPTVQSVVDTQWSDGHGGGAVDRIARTLELSNLRGWFFLDVELGDAMSPDIIADLAERLVGRGHEVGLYIGLGLLAPKGSIDERLQAMLARMPTRAHVGVMLGAGPDRESWLKACVDARLPAVVVSREAQLALPGWMRWRSSAFAASPTTIVLPTALFLSTPAHARDRVTRHTFDNRDSMAAANIAAVVDNMSRLEATRLIIAEIDPLLMLDRRIAVDADAAHAWNSTLKQLLPAWFAAGWKRSTKAYAMARGLSEIRLDLLSGMMQNLSQVTLPWARWSDVFDPTQATGWAPGAVAYEPMIEKRRGPRRMRRSAVRRYDDAYRLSLRADA
ncbi:hypothetical protein ASG17_02415 [Brevundimonas sp. Leaf363]|uniref:hypothetical protein n=1 Tax=Brevundimonas sp. Leaf363 TaxID=1736353 RepID=UPI0006F201B7|nr:hypothetical protein [Brevundimonas sp. Leaf363]KQS57590.1 hypothetical protein ASG17_02415 [Brevundimonas sp. Leaf363]